MAEYQALIELLTPALRARVLPPLPGPGARGAEKYAGQIQKRAQEVARYVLPVATDAYLYHTVCGLTLLRYWRLCRDLRRAPGAAGGRRAMVELLLEHRPALREAPRGAAAARGDARVRLLRGGGPAGGRAAAPRARDAWAAEFDDGARAAASSRLVDWTGARTRRPWPRPCARCSACRRAELADDEAHRPRPRPGAEPLLGETMNVTTLSKLSRALHHAVVHLPQEALAHRRQPGPAPPHDAGVAPVPARPTSRTTPDYVTPALVRDGRGGAARLRREHGADLGGARAPARRSASPTRTARTCCRTPSRSASPSRRTSCNLHHKLKMRLCYNAQEEIWRGQPRRGAADRRGRPAHRALAPARRARCGTGPGARPICPEGDRYCGVPVWRLAPEDWERDI